MTINPKTAVYVVNTPYCSGGYILVIIGEKRIPIACAKTVPPVIKAILLAKELLKNL